ncbi:MAG: hypothetical protein RLZZ568_2264 [Cyanobacteriota bacterium]|jgi:hypothetical protein
MEYFLWIAILMVYLVALALFAAGYRYTTFPRRKLAIFSLSLLWPLLIIVYPRFRRNFKGHWEKIGHYVDAKFR